MTARCPDYQLAATTNFRSELNVNKDMARVQCRADYVWLSRNSKRDVNTGGKERGKNSFPILVRLQIDKIAMGQFRQNLNSKPFEWWSLLGSEFLIIYFVTCHRLYDTSLPHVAYRQRSGSQDPSRLLLGCHAARNKHGPLTHDARPNAESVSITREVARSVKTRSTLGTFVVNY